MTPRLWIDVEDLFEYALGNPRPSGIQRLAFEMYQDIQIRFGATRLVNFVRHDPVRNSFIATTWPELEQLFAGLTRSADAPSIGPDEGPAADVEPAELPSLELPLELPTIVVADLPPLMAPIRPHTRSRQFARKLTYRLPLSLRLPMIRVMISNVDALVAWRGLLAALLRGVLYTPARLKRSRADRRDKRTYFAAVASHTANKPAVEASAAPPVVIEAPPVLVPDLPEPPASIRFATLMRPGDILLSLGSPWSHPDYGDLLRRHRERFGLRVAILVYDLIPLRRPEFCDRGLVRLFRAWFEGTLPQCDAVFAISRATAADVEAYAREFGYDLPGPVMPIPIGTGFSDPVAETEASTPLPIPGTYALVVSTIEARKNHLLLFRVWRRLLEELPREQVPTLVFAGRIGWMVDDLLRMMANTNMLDGKLVIIENPGDAELRSLYCGCLFTLFPSFYEGWGLPVTESLALGKPCLIADRTSLPEAGGHLARRFDPDNLHDAYRVIRDTIVDHKALVEWELQVRREFRAVAWSETVDSLLAGLDHPLAVRQVKVA